MSITYYDKELLHKSANDHPAHTVDETHPCYVMVREAIDGKSVFHWDKQQAFAMFNWYVESWHNIEIVDEFNTKTYDHDFKDILKKSHYVVKPGKKPVISKETIEDLFAAVTMERKMMEANGDSD